MRRMFVILVSDEYGENTEVAGVFDREPTHDDLAAARRRYQALFARWEDWPVGVVGAAGVRGGP